MSIGPSQHRELAIHSTNSTWEILGKSFDNISEDDAQEMIRRAEAAAYHWKRAEGSLPVNEARASWLLSRVWAVSGNGAEALHNARQCMHICESAGLADFDLAYAHESLARSYACLRAMDMAREHLSMARHIAINDPDDKALVEADITNEPWFGLN